MIDDLKNIIKELLKENKSVDFLNEKIDLFQGKLTDFVFENHLEETQEWKNIYSCFMIKSIDKLYINEANFILENLEKIKHYALKKKYEVEYFFSRIHPKIGNVSKNKFFDGYYADSVVSAFIELCSLVKSMYIEEKKEVKPPDGFELMMKSFNKENGILKFNDNQTTSDINIQEGYMYIFAGAMRGIRNTLVHDNDIIVSKEDAMDKLTIASHLMKMLDKAVEYKKTKKS